MRYLYSKIPKAEYLAAVRQRLDSPLLIGQERITGFVIGSFFAIAHHMPWEANRRITSECNRAYGFVKTVDGETEIAFIRGKGQFSPLWLVIWTCVFAVFFLYCRFDVGMGVLLGISFGCSLFYCALSALQSSLTENGETGKREVNKFLQDPKGYY